MITDHGVRTHVEQQFSLANEKIAKKQLTSAISIYNSLISIGEQFDDQGVIEDAKKRRQLLRERRNNMER